MEPTSNSLTRRAISLFAGLFGFATVLSGGSVALRLGAAHDLAGDVVPFVVWFNFAAGFAYLAAAVAIWKRWEWARSLAVLIAATTALVASGFIVAVMAGQAFEIRTVAALGFRFLVWAGIAIWLIRAAQR